MQFLKSNKVTFKKFEKRRYKVLRNYKLLHFYYISV